MININFFLQESSVRQASLADMNVCCSEKELKREAKNEVNWSITKDPKRCREFAKDGYRSVYSINLYIVLICMYFGSRYSILDRFCHLTDEMFYRCVPEEKCKSGGFDESDDDIELSGNTLVLQ